MSQNENRVKNQQSTAYSRRAYSTVCPSKLLVHQGTFHGLADSRCMSVSQMFSAQLQPDWTIAVLMWDPCSDLGKITDGTVTSCTLRKIPAGITQCFGLGQSILRYSLLVSLSSLLLQHCFLCKCDYNPMYYSQCTCTSTTKWKKI